MKKGSIFEFEGIPPLGEAIPLALQHVVAMVVGCVTPAIMISNAVKGGISEADRILLIQTSLVISMFTTLIQLFPIGGRKGNIAIGAGLPMILGISFAYVPTMQSIAAEYGIAAILGAEVIGGLVAFVFGIFIKKIRPLFPPLVAGTVVFTIGLSLYPTAIRYMAGGVGQTGYGSWENWLIALITLAVVTGLNFFGKGIFKLASILIGMIVGYIVSIPFGKVNLTNVETAGLFQLPQPMHFGMEFIPTAIISLSILFVINSVQAIGDYSATTVGAMDRHPTDTELQNGIIGYGLTNTISAFFGGLPVATYSQNVGIVATTKVINRFILALAAVVIGVAGLFPKFSALLTTIPYAVLGGATVTVFASIAMTGIKLIATQELNFRNTTIVGLSVALGMGVTQSSGCLAGFPDWVNFVFGSSPTVFATIMAIILNLVLPNGDKK